VDGTFLCLKSLSIRQRGSQVKCIREVGTEGARDSCEQGYKSAEKEGRAKEGISTEKKFREDVRKQAR